jgi:chromosome segregation ATPase
MNFANCCGMLSSAKNGTLKILVLTALSFNSVSIFAAQTKAVWYRYYDSKGVPNISTSVTPAHIRHGYEALDKNMQVIRKNKPYNVESDLKKAPERAAVAKQNAADIKLKRAYTNSKVATQKRDSTLASIKQQITFQQKQLQQLQEDRVRFKREEMEFTRKGKAVPDNLKTNLQNNLSNINALKKNLQSLQTNYLKTQADYNKIIARLKAIE